jgi:hypothetical protein
MASQISPGILLRERDITTATIVGAQALTGAFSTTFSKGEVGVITEIDSQRALLDTFGLPVEGNAEDWLVASEFLNYGGRLAVVRAETDGIRTASTATVDPNYKINTQADFVGQTINELFLARTPGRWGNSAQVVVADRGADIYVTVASLPAETSVMAGAVWEFDNGTSGEVLSWDADTLTAAIVLADPLQEPTTDNKLHDNNDDPIAGFTTDAATEAGRDVGVFNPPADVDGAEFEVTVAAADNLTVGQAVSSAAGTTIVGEANETYSPVGTVEPGDAEFTVVRDALGAIASVTPTAGGTGILSGQTLTILGGDVGGAAPGDNITITVADADLDGGAVTVTLTNAGLTYSGGDTITLASVDTGNGSPIVVTVTTLADDIAITATSDWWTNTTITVGTQELALNNLGVRPGTSAYAAARGIEFDEVTVAVIDVDGKISGTVGNVLERINSLSKLTDGRSTENGAIYYKDIINDEPQYIYAGAATVTPVITNNKEAWGQDSDDLSLGDKFEILGVYTKQFGFGADDYLYDAADIQNAYDVFGTADQTELDFILMGGSMGDEDSTKLKAAKVVAIADSRKDCVAFVSPHKGNQIGTGGVSLNAAAQKTNTINFFRSLPSTSYAVFDSGYKYLYDRFNDRFRYIPCNGDVAGLCVSTSQQLADWYSPAGVARGALKNAIKLAYTPSQADRDDLYTNRINPITILPGTGVTLFGDKTALASTSAFDRINVRRLFLNLEKRVERLASGVLFEQNDVLTRSSFASAVNSYLAEVQARRGVTDFLVVCDETNNTPDVIDRNEFVAEIFVKAARSINFINITFTATKTGVAFAEVVGR